MSDQEASAGGSQLQFDQVEQSNHSPTPDSLAVQCGECRELLRTEYFSIGDRIVCDRCRRLIEKQAEPPTGVKPFVRACLFGLGAGIAGAAVYYAVLAITNFEIALVAILIGYMVGAGVRKGARGRGGLRLQIMAVALTYMSIAMAYVPIAIQAAMQARKSQQTATNASAGQATPTGAASHATEPDVHMSLARLLVELIKLFVFAMALPVFIVVGSLPSGLISAVIIYAGMHRAWRMTAAPVIDVLGPYRVGAAVTAQG